MLFYESDASCSFCQKGKVSYLESNRCRVLNVNPRLYLAPVLTHSRQDILGCLLAEKVLASRGSICNTLKECDSPATVVCARTVEEVGQLPF